MDSDRKWFKLHPNATAYWRPMTMAERADVLASHADGCTIVAGRVCVTFIAPGVRVRSFSGIVVAGPVVTR